MSIRVVRSAVAGAAVHVTVAGHARFRRIRGDTVWPVVADLAFLAVDPGRVLLRKIWRISNHCICREYSIHDERIRFFFRI